MNILTKSAKIVTTLLFAGGLLLIPAGSAVAQGLPGQLEGGNSHYQISDLTTGSGFSNTQSANACDELEYRLTLYNPGPGVLDQVNLEATINTVTPYTSFTSVATAFTPGGATPETNFDATLNLSTAQTQSYVAGSTELLNSAGNVINSSGSGGTLPDTITTGGGGINIGSLGYSVTEYVQFETKVNCPTPIPPTCNSITTNQAEVESVSYTANSATVTGVTLGLFQGTNTSGSPVATSNQVPFTFTNLTAGQQYTIVATVQTSMGSVTSTNCQATFTTPSTPKTPTPPASTTPPATLVNTGPGSVVAIFAGTAIGGTAVYHWLLKRRFAKS